MEAFVAVLSLLGEIAQQITVMIVQRTKAGRFLLTAQITPDPAAQELSFRFRHGAFYTGLRSNTSANCLNGIVLAQLPAHADETLFPRRSEGYVLLHLDLIALFSQMIPKLLHRHRLTDGLVNVSADQAMPSRLPGFVGIPLCV